LLDEEFVFAGEQMREEVNKKNILDKR